MCESIPSNDKVILSLVDVYPLVKGQVSLPNERLVANRTVIRPLTRVITTVFCQVPTLIERLPTNITRVRSLAGVYGGGGSGHTSEQKSCHIHHSDTVALRCGYAYV